MFEPPLPSKQYVWLLLLKKQPLVPELPFTLNGSVEVAPAPAVPPTYGKVVQFAPEPALPPLTVNKLPKVVLVQLEPDGL